LAESESLGGAPADFGRMNNRVFDCRIWEMTGMNPTADLWDDIDAPKATALAQQEQAAAHTGDIARQQDRIVRLEKRVADVKLVLFGPPCRRQPQWRL
jgi:hypothetical protein